MDSQEQERLAKFDHLIVTPEGYQAIGPTSWLAFNLEKKPLDDVRVRQAIAYAIDRKYIISALFKGDVTEATGPIVPNSPFYSDKAERYDYNIEKANTLLDSAGYRRNEIGVRFSLSINHNPGVKIFRDIVEYLRFIFRTEVGIDLKIHTFGSVSEWIKAVSNGDFQMTFDAVFNWPDPVISVHRTYDSRNIRKGVMWSNTQNYRKPEVDALLDSAAVERDFDKRKALYAKFQRIIMDDLPLYPLFIGGFATIYHKGLMGLNDSILGPFSPMDNVYWRKRK